MGKEPLVEVPWITTEQMIEVDRAMMEDYRILLIQMMENAGRNLAHLARSRFLDGNPEGRRVTVMAGRGGNGGGALVCARRLHNWGARVEVFLSRAPEQYKEGSIPAHQLDVLQRMGVSIAQADGLDGASTPELVVDGVIGYSLSGAPRGTAAALIEWANAQAAPVLSLDAPSGVDTTTGQAFEPSIMATATMTLAMPKIGLRAEGIEASIGELYLADISVPPGLYSGPGLEYDLGSTFAKEDIVRLW